PTAAGTPSGSPTEVSSANRAYFLAWNDATAKANLVGLHNSNAAGSTNTTSLSLDGVGIGNSISHYMPAANVSQAVSVAAQVTPSEGLHYFGFLGSVNGNTGVWSASVGGSIWQ
ncbi:hypothetical protein, partial [Methylobacterium sp. E-066]|uniref:hypothetical protein n=1 Tax=Methylobacterium sp. E-066 TaxID=2836584 RepID=UPI001FB92D98